MLIEDLIATSMLAVVAPGATVDLPDGFFFFARADKLRDRHISAFRDWLVAEAAGSSPAVPPNELAAGDATADANGRADRRQP